MRVLVTGHKGYLGSVLVPALRAAGHDVVGLDTCFFGECTLGPDDSGVPSLAMDLRDVQPAALAGYDAVAHLAALSNDPLGNLEPEVTFEINHLGSARLAGLAKEAGVRRFVLSSSCSIYGASGGDRLVDETAPMQPLTPYAISKVRLEEELHRLADDRFTPVYLRNATAHGYSPHLRTDLVLNDLVASAFLTGQIVVRSDGTPWRPVVHTEDIASAFVAALEAPAAAVHDQAINVGSEDQNYQVRDLAEIVNDVVPGSEVVITGEYGSDPRSYRVDFSKLRRILPSHRVRWDARASAAQLYEAFCRHGFRAGDVEHRFRRLPWLEGLQRSGRLDTELRWMVSADRTSAGPA